MRIFFCNVNYQLAEADLRVLFEEHGEVKRFKVVLDRDTGASRGFGFCELALDADGYAAMAALDGTIVAGRRIVVREANPRTAFFREAQ
jgi:RNA recognition motif-containing protein